MYKVIERGKEMARKKHQPPAKIKYDSTHPIVSVRADQKLKEQLDEIKKASGKSVGDILREAVKVQAPSIKEAYTRGWNDATQAYRVQYKCSECGGTIFISSPDEIKAVARYMRENGWAHSECVRK